MEGQGLITPEGKIRYAIEQMEIAISRGRASLQYLSGEVPADEPEAAAGAARWEAEHHSGNAAKILADLVIPGPHNYTCSFCNKLVEGSVSSEARMDTSNGPVCSECVANSSAFSQVSALGAGAAGHF